MRSRTRRIRTMMPGWRWSGISSFACLLRGWSQLRRRLRNRKGRKPPIRLSGYACASVCGRTIFRLTHCRWKDGSNWNCWRKKICWPRAGEGERTVDSSDGAPGDGAKPRPCTVQLLVLAFATGQRWQRSLSSSSDGSIPSPALCLQEASRNGACRASA